MNTFYHGDCLLVMRHDIEPESVDLIYLDPPFFTGKVQKGKMRWQPGAMEVSYEDSKRFWSEKADVMREKAPIWLSHIARNRPDFGAYLWYMIERLRACHKVLKRTGSIYLHCDWRASHYLKMIMDERFGVEQFQNEIIWHYGLGGSSGKRWQRKYDSILYYSKANSWTFNPIMVVATSQRMKGQMKKDDDVWDIPALNNMARERSGYPTQKPLELLEHIIIASSNEGDLVLDAFCGCGTTMVAASKLNRRFIGIDIHPTAFGIIKNRGHELFSQSRYISRDIEEVLSMNPREFEDWVNEYYKATKPYPDKGVDGITPEGIPIQVKTFQIKYDTLDKLLSSSRFHPSVPRPVKKLIFVSQTGFDDGARQRKFEIETAEEIEIILVTPKEMLMVGE